MKKIYIIILLILAKSGFAQTDSLTIDDFYIDFATPDVSAFGLLQLNSDAIVRPGNLKEFGVALSSMANKSGDLTPGIGIEYAPLMSIAKKNKDFWSNRFKWQNLAVTAATNTIDTLGTRLAFGFKWVPLDYGDPLGDKKFYAQIVDYLKVYNGGTPMDKKIKFMSEVAAELQNLASSDIQKLVGVIEISNEAYKRKLRARHEGGEITSYRTFILDTLATLPAYTALPLSTKEAFNSYVDLFVGALLNEKSLDAYLSDIIKKKKEEYKNSHWNALAFQISGGWVYNSPTTSYDDLDHEKSALFASFSFPLPLNNWFRKHSQFILHAQATSDISGITPEKIRKSLGGRILLGNSDNRFLVEGMYSNTTFDNDNLDSNTYFRWAIGGEIKLSQGSWLELAMGGFSQLSGEKDTKQLLPRFGVRHALQNKRRYKTN